MKLTPLFAATLLSLLSTYSAFAETGLVIHGVEKIVGKFHRYDNQVHPYGAGHAWAPYILPAAVATARDTSTATVVQNADQSISIYFSTLDDLISSAVQQAQAAHAKIAVFNIHAHGLPGALFFPSDAQALKSSECYEWKSMADDTDENSYMSYYSSVSKDELDEIDNMSNDAGSSIPCTSGLNEWTAVAAKTPDIQSYFTDDARIHLLSCVVGLGTNGQAFTEGLAKIFLKGANAHVETSMNLGMGDWSMSAGMGFWAYQNEDQLEKFNEGYPVDRRDSEFAQKGTIRLSGFNSGQWFSSQLADQDFMLTGMSNLDTQPAFLRPWETFSAPVSFSPREASGVRATSVRVFRTSVTLPVSSGR